MDKNELTSNPQSCLNKSSQHEPLFVLCARDPLAPKLVRGWAAAALNIGVRPAKVTEAYELAARMDDWQRANGVKAPN